MASSASLSLSNSMNANEPYGRKRNKDGELGLIGPGGAA